MVSEVIDRDIFLRKNSFMAGRGKGPTSMSAPGSRKTGRFSATKKRFSLHRGGEKTNSTG